MSIQKDIEMGKKNDAMMRCGGEMVVMVTWCAYWIIKIDRSGNMTTGATSSTNINNINSNPNHKKTKTTGGRFGFPTYHISFPQSIDTILPYVDLLSFVLLCYVTYD
ncbi:hypothetical protein Droror1_Dr00027508 [Drosera rotundifolia]